MKIKRMRPEARKQDILAAALPLAERLGYDKISRSQIAEAAQVSGPAVQYHFGTMQQLRRDLMRLAIREGCLKVIAQGVLADDPQVAKASSELRRAALAAFLPE